MRLILAKLWRNQFFFVLVDQHIYLEHFYDWPLTFYFGYLKKMKVNISVLVKDFSTNLDRLRTSSEVNVLGLVNDLAHICL